MSLLHCTPCSNVSHTFCFWIFCCSVLYHTRQTKRMSRLRLMHLSGWCTNGKHLDQKVRCALLIKIADLASHKGGIGSACSHPSLRCYWISQVLRDLISYRGHVITPWRLVEAVVGVMMHRLWCVTTANLSCSHSCVITCAVLQFLYISKWFEYCSVDITSLSHPFPRAIMAAAQMKFYNMTLITRVQPISIWSCHGIQSTKLPVCLHQA